MYDPYKNEDEYHVDERRPVQKRVHEGGHALAEGTIKMSEGAFHAFVTGAEVGKSEAWTAARLAGIQGAKQADELVLVSHSFNISALEMRFMQDDDNNRVTIQCDVRTRERTGAETAALVGCGIALMVLVDTLRALDPGITVENLHIKHQ